MSSSIEALSQPISEDSPSGEDLEYDPQYQEMETLLNSRGESAIEGIDSQEAEPDWRAVEKLARALSERTRDLRVQVHSAIASIHTRGLPAFRDNLQLLKIYLEKFWDDVHPRLDADDDNDPTMRMNSLQMLNEHSLITGALNQVKLVELKGMGHFGVREVDLAQGRESPAAGEEIPDVNVIRQAFLQTDRQPLESLRTAVSESISLLVEIDQIWKDRTGNAEGLSFEIAKRGLQKISGVLIEFMPGDTVGEAATSTGEQGQGTVAPAVTGAINSRADVIRVLERICDYYVVNEPSSPVPLLLRRAQRLAEKSFLEILADMVPDGLQQAKVFSGKSDDKA